MSTEPRKGCHPSVPFFVIQVADTGSLYNGSAPMMSSQCSFLVIPVLGSSFP
ncbi:hypothetical protein [Wolbachia endosymbiont of Dactylopius coccus]